MTIHKLMVTRFLQEKICKIGVFRMMGINSNNTADRSGVELGYLMWTQ